MGESVPEYGGPVVDILPEQFGGIFSIGGDGSLVGVGDRNGCSTVGVIDGDMKLSVIIAAEGFVDTFESLLGGVGSGGWRTGVRVEDTALGSAGLEAGVGKAGEEDCVREVEEPAVVEDSVDLSGSIGESCRKSGNGLKDVTDVGAALINGVGGQSGSGPSWGTLSLFSPLSLRDPSLNLLKRKALILPMVRAGVLSWSSQGPVERNYGGKRRAADKDSGDDKTEERPVPDAGHSGESLSGSSIGRSKKTRGGLQLRGTQRTLW